MVELTYSAHYPVTFNNVALTAEMLPSIKKATGAENVIEVPATMGAEDFSFFAKEVAGLYFFVGGLPKGKDVATSGPHHTAEFMLDDSAFKTGVKAFCNLLFDYMEKH